jgi:predicted nucleotidyltransferase
MNDIVESIKHELKWRKNAVPLFIGDYGSRAIGLNKSDSDYDYKVIYLQPLADYHRISVPRDTVEILINDDGKICEIGCWDIHKAVRLFYRGNYTMIEWLCMNSQYIHPGFPIEEFIQLYLHDYNPIRHVQHFAGRGLLTIKKARNHKLHNTIYCWLACNYILQKRFINNFHVDELLKSLNSNRLRNEISKFIEMRRNDDERYQSDYVILINDIIKDLKEYRSFKSDKVKRNKDDYDKLLHQCLNL